MNFKGCPGFLQSLVIWKILDEVICSCSQKENTHNQKLQETLRFRLQICIDKFKPLIKYKKEEFT